MAQIIQRQLHVASFGYSKKSPLNEAGYFEAGWF
jgi:hypothetical protein